MLKLIPRSLNNYRSIHSIKNIGKLFSTEVHSIPEVTKTELKKEIKKENKKDNNNHSNSETVWIKLFGLSRYSSRRDVVDICKNLQPIALDPYIDMRYQMTGEWALQIPKMYSSQDNLRNIVTANNSRFDLRFRYIDNIATLNSNLASKKNITNSTIIARKLVKAVKVDHLINVFERYQFATIALPVIQVTHNDHEDYNDFIIHFATPQEAQRATIEKCIMSVEGRTLELFWYDI